MRRELWKTRILLLNRAEENLYSTDFACYCSHLGSGSAIALLSGTVIAGVGGLMTLAGFIIAMVSFAMEMVDMYKAGSATPACLKSHCKGCDKRF